MKKGQYVSRKARKNLWRASHTSVTCWDKNIARFITGFVRSGYGTSNLHVQYPGTGFNLFYPPHYDQTIRCYVVNGITKNEMIKCHPWKLYLMILFVLFRMLTHFLLFSQTPSVQQTHNINKAWTEKKMHDIEWSHSTQTLLIAIILENRHCLADNRS